MVLVDAFTTDKKPDGFYIVPIDEIKQIIQDGFDAAFPDGVRPLSPESTHAVVSPKSVQQYRDKWRFYAAD